MKDGEHILTAVDLPKKAFIHEQRVCVKVKSVPLKTGQCVFIQDIQMERSES